MGSPIFLNQVDGYHIQFIPRWDGVNKENFMVLLILRLDERNAEIPLKPFCYEYTFEVFNTKGRNKTYRVTYEELTAKSPGGVVIENLRDVVVCPGPEKLITSPYEDYLVNDSLFLSCTIHL